MKNLLFSIKGRISQKDYTILSIIYFSIMMIIQFGMYYFISYNFISTNINIDNFLDGQNINYVALLFSKVSLLTFILPTILTFVIFYLIFVVMVKRLHDIGYSGWYTLLTILPIISTIMIFVLMIIKSEKKENIYGKIPQDYFDL